MLIITIIGILIITGIGVVCLAAYKIKAELFEFSTAILKIVSFSIKIISPNAGRAGSEQAA